MTMKLTQYQVDAFANHVFEGNPAAVCPLEKWLDDEILQAIAEENNLSETAFFVPTERGFHLRWFTPVTEVDLCGHATLASAHIIFGTLAYTKDNIQFETKSGILEVEIRDGLLAMTFPSTPPIHCEPPTALLEGLGVTPLEVLEADDYIVVLESEVTLRALTPDLTKFLTLGLRGVCVTARSETVDFVSRFFAPKLGVSEDPVTGSTHCELTPYWARKLGKTCLTARQVSKRGGNLICELSGGNVILKGNAVTFMTSQLVI